MVNEKIWLVVEPPTPLKNQGVEVSWDDFSIPNWMESHSEFHGSSHHQPVGMMGLWWEDGIMMIIVG